MQWMSPFPFVYHFLLLLPFFPGQNGENKFIEWSTDTIVVWEGDSINITCSKNSSENEVGTYLRTGTPPANIVYVSTRNTSYIHPDFANRTEFLNGRTTLTITVHNVQKSDSNIYLCKSYITKNNSHIRHDGNTITVVVKAKTNGIIGQSPLSVIAQQGESINIICTSESSNEGIIFFKTHMQLEKVLYVSSQNTVTISPAFANRLECSNQEKKLVITLHNLQKNDTDLYMCAAVLKNFSLMMSESGTMVLVEGGEQTACNISSLAIYPLIIVVVLLSSALICYILHRVNMKKYFQKKKRNVVYEDMSFSSRSNTLVRTNTYSNGN
ncbi:T-cell antigen CD7 [Cyrtonyx montezumae]|uniref:T-cell antigen CD7 n=1 Tax=Cyrtonyx montezumae TaxID=9017 RepID=UPI0032DB74D3